jgi:hypothetical protein
MSRIPGIKTQDLRLKTQDLRNKTEEAQRELRPPCLVSCVLGLESLRCLAFCVLILLASCLNAYSASNDGGDAGAFLKNGIGVRPISMGKAYVAIADDANAGYWNPAGLAILNGPQLSAMYSNPMNYALISDAGVKDIGYHTVSLAYPTRLGSIGLNLAFLSVGDIYVVKDKSGPTGETFEDKELGVITSYAKSITHQIHLGANLKFIRQSLWDEEGSGMGLDLGGLYEPMYNLTLGMTLQDLIEPKIQLLEDGVEDSIPRKIRLGISYRLMDDRILIGADMDKSSGRSVKFHLGTEIQPMRDLALRAGYTTDTGEFSAGVGFRVSVIQLDYGFGLLNLGSTHRISLTVDLSQLTTRTEQEATDDAGRMPALPGIDE